MVLWLCPLPLWAWVASWVFASGLVVLMLPIAWLIFFPFAWLSRVRLTSLGTDQYAVRWPLVSHMFTNLPIQLLYFL
jgi:hypothetical protein